MAKFSKKVGGKEVGAAEVYAQPHTMSGQGVTAVLPVENNKDYLRKMNVSVANSRSNDYPPTKTDGITMRGYGAATKGIKSRGPMA